MRPRNKIGGRKIIGRRRTAAVRGGLRRPEAVRGRCVRAMPLLWSTVVSWIFLALAFACTGLTLHDLFGRGYRQHMRVMEAVWPVAALYFGPLSLWAYHRRVRSLGRRTRQGSPGLLVQRSTLMTYNTEHETHIEVVAEQQAQVPVMEKSLR